MQVLFTVRNKLLYLSGFKTFAISMHLSSKSNDIFSIQISLISLYLLQKRTFCRLTGLQPYRLQIMVFSARRSELYLGV